MKKIFCTDCGKELLPIPPNLVRYNKNTGAPVYALWLSCQNGICKSVVHGAPQKELVSSHATKGEAEKWCPIPGPKRISFWEWVNK